MEVPGPGEALVSVSLLAARGSRWEAAEEAVKMVEETGADLLHIDVMDGKFVQNETVWNDPARIRSISTRLPLDVHIMVEDPEERALSFVHAGAKMLTFHAEAARDPEMLMSKLHRWGVKAGLAISPETPVEKALAYAPLMDYVLIMTVRPGKAGQEFLPETLEKVASLRARYPQITIQVDGGMNPQTARLAREAGATIIVAGHAVFSADDPAGVVKSLAGRK